MPIKRLLMRAALPLLMLFVTQTLLAQNRVITGKITDSKDGSPVSGASVQPKGSNQGVSSQADGSFTISVPANINTLVVSSVGFKELEVNITDKTSVDVSLETTGAALSEVVVVGYGTVRKRDLTGAVVSVKEKDFNKGTFTSPDQLIQGKVAGVQVLNNAGQPGGATTVKVRGNSAITGSGQPLYVVDGIPLDGRSARPGLDVGGIGMTPAGNPLNFLNPNDIASMEILKDASATAIYGSRAAYGVVLITTKRGASGQPKLDLGASFGISSLMRKIDILDAGEFRSALAYYGVSAANDKGADVDAMDAILRTANIQTYSAAVSGGNDNAKYRISTSLLDQEGIVRKSDFKKYTVSLNSNFKFLEKKNLGIDFNITSSQYVENIVPISNNAGSTGSLIGQALQWNPTEALRKPNDSLNIASGGGIINPLAASEAYNDNSKVTTVLGSISPYLKITKDLEYRMLYSINYSSGVRRGSVNSFLNLNEIIGKGRAYIANNELITQQVTHTLNYTKQINTDLSLNALVGYEFMKYKNKGSAMNGFGPDAGGFGNYGLDYTNYIQYSNNSSRSISSFIDPSSELQSFFGRAVLNYQDKYLVTATFRADGSTKFGENNNYGYFPSFSAAWVLSKESFFNADFVNDLRIRGGYGITGNQEFPSGASQGRYSFTNNGGLGLTNNPNPDLKWQSDAQWNIGLDFAVLDNRITGSFDYFNKTTTDLLFPTVPIRPSPPGSSVTWKNLEGEVVNKGFEVMINANIVRNKDFGWDFGVNASFIKNEVSGLDAPISTGGLHGQGITGTLVETIRNGLPINAFWTRNFAGLDKTTGQAIYPEGDVFSYQGNPNPKTLLGISTSVFYKKLSLVINLNGAFGQKIYNNTLNNVINVGSINGGKNIARSVYESDVKEAFSNPVTASSRFIEDGSYLKLANASLSYSVGDIAKFIKGANIFLNGQNLFVITKFSGFDPEVNVDKTVNSVPSVGIEYAPYPSARTITLGVNFSL